MKKRTRIKIWISLFIIMVVVAYGSHISFAMSPNYVKLSEKFSKFMDEWRVIMAGLAGLGALTSILIFIFHFIKLGSLSSHPHLRRELLGDLLISGICTTLLGGMTMVLTLFYRIIFGS